MPFDEWNFTKLQLTTINQQQQSTISWQWIKLLTICPIHGIFCHWIWNSLESIHYTFKFEKKKKTFENNKIEMWMCEMWINGHHSVLLLSFFFLIVKIEGQCQVPRVKCVTTIQLFGENVTGKNWR